MPFDIRQIETPCPLRARLYEAELRAAYDAFTNPRNPPLSLSPVAAEKTGLALQDRELLNTLAALLDFYTVVGVSADLDRCRPVLFENQPPGQPLNLDPHFRPENNAPPAAGRSERELTAAYHRYFDWFILPAQVSSGGQVLGGLQAFWGRYPMLRHAITTINNNYIENIRIACQHIGSDWPVINSVFFPAERPARLTRIEPSGSDTHKGGKQVLFLTFDFPPARATKKLVYKPTDIELDYLLVGDTEKLRELGLFASRSLVELLNPHLPEFYRLPTYRILPRSPGSSLAEAPDQSLPVTQSYGYLEFLSHDPDSPAQYRPGAESDWITNQPAVVERFYGQWGVLLALAYVYSLTDLHYENVIVHRCQPHLIDLEAALSGPMANLAGTGILDANSGPWVNRTTVRRRQAIRDDQTANLDAQPSYEAVRTQHSAANMLNYARNPNRPEAALPAEYLGLITNGLDLTLRALSDEIEYFGNWFMNLVDVVGRFVPYPTHNFYPRLARVFSKRYCTQLAPVPPNPVPPAYFARPPFTLWKGYADSLYRDPAATRNQGPPPEMNGDAVYPSRWPEDQPYYAIETAAHNFLDYLNGDIPAYYHRLGQPTLLNARGQPVNIMNNLPGAGATPQSTPNPTRHDFFPQPTWNIVYAQLEALREPEGFQQIRDRCVQEILDRFMPAVAALQGAHAML